MGRTMAEPRPLDRLAHAAGIEPHYHDIWGQPRAVSVDTVRAFLAAMGIAAASEGEIAASLAALEATPWRRPLEPVVVLTDDRAKTVGVRLAAGARDATLAWRLDAEDGRRFDGEARPDDLALVGSDSVDGRTLEHRLLTLPHALPLGYHRLAVVGPALVDSGAETTLIVAPRHAHLPDALAHDPGIWGFALQLYGLQGAHSWGMGDFGALGGFAADTARLGASALGLNPLHALFPGNPAHASPYSPSSRRYLNPLYIDVEAVPDWVDAPLAGDDLTALRAGALVDYVGVAAIKLPALERLFATFRYHHLERGGARADAFRAFQRAGGAALEGFAAFEALAEHFRREDPGLWSWRDWPDRFRDPASAAVSEFARAHEHRVLFHQYLQWVADCQLGAAAAACTQGGMAVGLYRDLALGVDPHGAEAWADRHLLADGISTGAPPDGFNLAGQSWGLPPYNPHALRDAAYRPFIACLAANMCHAGALRIDHVMGFARLFWIPPGGGAAEGGYVRYPLDDLLAITALESRRARCLVVGEDLGTVPEGLRARLAAARILSTRLLYFERDDAGFRSPDAYPELAHVAIGTHDLPTFPGWWRARDVALRATLGLIPDLDGAAALREERARDRAALVAVLRAAGLEISDAVLVDPDGDLAPLVDATYRFLAMSRGRLLMVQLEDVLGIEEQVNLPGTIDTHPNWQRKLSVGADDLTSLPRLRRLARALRTLRPSVTSDPGR